MKMKENNVYAVDFDGTCVTHEYPFVGKNIGAAPVLKKLVAKGYKLMLWTMRGNKPFKTNGLNIDTLKEAVDWFERNEIPLWGINQNPSQQASGWSNSNKQHANLYIDDAALGAPFKYDPELSVRPFIDWVKVEEMLKEHKIID